jgi:hypothetical protein
VQEEQAQVSVRPEEDAAWESVGEVSSSFRLPFRASCLGTCACEERSERIGTDTCTRHSRSYWVSGRLAYRADSKRNRVAESASATGPLLFHFVFLRQMNGTRIVPENNLGSNRSMSDLHLIATGTGRDTSLSTTGRGRQTSIIIPVRRLAHVV